MGLRAEAVPPPPARDGQPLVLTVILLAASSPTDRAVRVRPARPRRTRARRPDAHGPSLLRHRRARARLLLPRPLRHPDLGAVAFLVAILSTLIGTAIGAFAGFFGGWVDNVLMRFTDLVLVLPGLAVLLTAAAFLGNGKPYSVALILAFLFWTARPDRARHVPLTAREGVRRGGEGRRLRRPTDHVPAHAPELARPDHRQRDAARRPPRSSPRRHSRSSASASSRRRPRSGS